MKPGDVITHFDRFQPGNFKQNSLFARKYEFVYEIKKCSLESLAISWIWALSQRNDFHRIPSVTRILPIPSGSTKDQIEKNLGKLIDLTKVDLDLIDNIKGYRYHESHHYYA